MTEKTDYQDIINEMKIFESIMEEDGIVEDCGKDAEAAEMQREGMNAAELLQLGADCQREISALSDRMLQIIKNRGESGAGALLEEMIGKIGSFDDRIAGGGGKSGFFGRKKERPDLGLLYEALRDDLEEITQKLEEIRIGILKDILIFEDLRQRITNCRGALEERIAEGGRLLEAFETTDPDATDAALRKSRISLLENRLSQLRTAVTVAAQMEAQAQMLIESETSLAAGIQFTLTATVPLWKNAVSMAVSSGMQDDRQVLQKSVGERNTEALAALKETMAEEAKNSSKEDETVRRLSQWKI